MRTGYVVAAALVLSVRVSSAQTTFYRLDPDIERANAHYTRGWEAFRVEDWDNAAKEFQHAIDWSSFLPCPVI